MAKVTRRTLKAIQKVKKEVTKMVDMETLPKLKPGNEPLKPGELSSEGYPVVMAPQTKEDKAQLKQKLQIIGEEEREVLAALKKAEPRQPKAATKKRPSVKSKGKRTGKAG
jgi:hypothetical protein